MNTTFNKSTTSAALTEFSGLCTAPFDRNDQPVDGPYYISYGFFNEGLDNKLDEDEVEEVLPVIIEALPQNAPNTIMDNAANWGRHSSCYLTAWRWFKDIYLQHGDEFANELYATLTAVEKAIVQRGFDIFYDDAWPPLVGHEHYIIGLQTNRERKSPFDCPVKPIKNDPIQILGTEPKMDAATAGTFLH